MEKASIAARHLAESYSLERNWREMKNIFQKNLLEGGYPRMKKKWFWYPVANIKNRFLFGAYGKDVYIEPGVVINRPRYVHVGDHVRIKRNTSINLHPKDKKSKEILLFIGDNVIISESCFISACNRIVIEENVGISPNVMIIDNSRKPGDISRPSKEQDLKIGSCPYWSRFLDCLWSLRLAECDDRKTLYHRCPLCGE